MIPKYTYLLINLFTIVGPLALIAHPKHQFYKKLIAIIPSILVTAFFFLSFDHLYTRLGVWGFDSKYTLGVFIGNLPIEEYLFFLTVPYACIFIYQALKDYISKDLFGDSIIKLFKMLAVGLFILSLFAFPRKYSLFVTIGSACILWLGANKLSSYKASIFAIAFLISIVPMFIVNGVLTSIPIVWYNDLENCGVRLGTIPIEDFGYNLILLMMNTLLYEFFLSKKESST